MYYDYTSLLNQILNILTQIQNTLSDFSHNFSSYSGVISGSFYALLVICAVCLIYQTFANVFRSY